MDKTEFIEYLQGEDKNHLKVLYAFHKQHTKKPLTPAQFFMKVQYFDSLQVERRVGEMVIKEKVFDFVGLYNRLEKYFMDKFEICSLYDKEGRFVKYVY